MVERSSITYGEVVGEEIAQEKGKILYEFLVSAVAGGICALEVERKGDNV